MAESKKHGVTVKDVPALEFVVALAVHLKKKLDLPEWHDLVKTANFKELPPQNPDWYFIRAASLARKVYLRGGTGIGSFTKVYGGRRRTRGVKRNCFDRASKGLLRHILQALANIDIVQRRKDKKGRWITTNGQHELDVIAGQVATAKTAESA